MASKNERPLHLQVKELEENEARLEARRNELERELKLRLEYSDGLRKDLNEQKEKNIRLNQQIKSQEQQIKQYQESEETLKHDLDKQKSTNSRLLRSLDGFKALKEEHKALSAQNEDNKKDLDETKALNVKLEEELVRAETAKDRLEKDLYHQSKETKKLEVRIGEIRGSHIRRCERLNDELRASKADNGRLRSEVEQLEANVAESSTKITTLEQDVARHEATAKTLTHEVEAFWVACRGYRTALDGFFRTRAESTRLTYRRVVLVAFAQVAEGYGRGGAALANAALTRFEDGSVRLLEPRAAEDYDDGFRMRTPVRTSAAAASLARAFGNIARSLPGAAGSVADGDTDEDEPLGPQIEAQRKRRRTEDESETAQAENPTTSDIAMPSADDSTAEGHTPDQSRDDCPHSPQLHKAETSGYLSPPPTARKQPPALITKNASFRGFIGP